MRQDADFHFLSRGDDPRHYFTTLFSSRLAFSSTVSWQGFSVWYALQGLYLLPEKNVLLFVAIACGRCMSVAFNEERYYTREFLPSLAVTNTVPSPL